MTCKFCESYESWHNIHESYNQKRPKEERSKYEYTAALIIRSWIPKVRTKRHAGRTIDCRNQGIGYELNYCPECGKRLKGEK